MTCEKALSNVTQKFHSVDSTVNIAGFSEKLRNLAPCLQLLDVCE